MRFMPLLCLLLCACSTSGVWTDTSLPLPTATASAAPPGQEEIQKGIQKAVTEAKLEKPVEISALRKTDHGPGGYFVCLREVSPAPDKPRRTYSAFFDNTYKDSRLSVILEECETQQYSLVN